MLKVGGLVIILLFTRLLAFAQLGTIDSLETILISAGTDTTRVKLLNELSFKYLANNPEHAKQYAEEALSLSKTLHYKTGEIAALNRLGENEFRQSNYAMAVERTTQSLKLAEQEKDTSNMAQAYRVLGNIYTFGFKQYEVALQYQLNALKIFESRKDKRNIASFCGNITWIYAIMNQNLEEAHRLASLGVHLSDSLGNKQLLSYNYNSKGLIFMQEGKLDSALTYLNKSIQEAREVNDRAVIAYDKSIIGNVYLKQNNYKKAIDQFEQAVRESKEVNQREVLKDSYLGLTKGYEGLANYSLAYKNHRLYSLLKDSLVNWETTQKALMTKMSFEEEKREAKIIELELANQQVRKEKIIYSVLFAVVLIAMVTVMVLVVQRSATNKLLQEKNVEIAEKNLRLEQANQIKDKFFSIIGHDLRSPLSSLKGLLGMVVRNEISDQEFKKFAPKLNQLVIGTNETLENLLQWSHSQMEGWKHAPASHELKPLVNKCTGLFTDAARTKNIELINGIDEKETVHVDANQMELILRNLIHNAIKFTADGGVVNISARRSGEFLEVRVTDTGMGMTAEELTKLFQKHTTHSTRGTQGEKGTGLGLLLCKEMAENNGGRISVTSESGKGSTFHVFLKTMAAA